jgi:hypothetical protein
MDEGNQRLLSNTTLQKEEKQLGNEKMETKETVPKD